MRSGDEPPQLQPQPSAPQFLPFPVTYFCKELTTISPDQKSSLASGTHAGVPTPESECLHNKGACTWAAGLSAERTDPAPVSAFLLREAPRPEAATSPGNLLETVTPQTTRNGMGASRGSRRKARMPVLWTRSRAHLLNPQNRYALPLLSLPSSTPPRSSPFFRPGLYHPENLSRPLQMSPPSFELT